MNNLEALVEYEIKDAKDLKVWKDKIKELTVEELNSILNIIKQNNE